MGEQVRGVAAEQAYNKWWLVGTLGGLLLLSMLASAWMLSVAKRVPDQLAIHWNGRNEVDGWASLWNIAATNVPLSVGVGGLIVVLAVVSRGQNTLLARIGAGFGVGFGLAMSALMVAIVAGQLDQQDTSDAALSGPVLGGGLAVAFGMGALAMWLYSPGDIDRTPNPQVQAANVAATSGGSALAAAAKAKASNGYIMRIPVSMGVWSWVWALGVGGLVGVSTFFIFPVLGLLGVVVAAIVWIFCSGTVVIGPEGHKVLAGGFWKVMPLQWEEVRAASVADIKAMDYGGWGYRMNGGAVGFIMGSGPALVMEAGFHQKFIVSMPDADTAGEAAALVNAYAHSTTVKN